VDRELVERAQGGDRDAFTALAAASLDRLFAVAVLMLRDRSAAEDAVQEALIRAWRDLPALRDATRVDAWLRRLVVHAAYDEARRGRRHRADLIVLPGGDGGGRPGGSEPAVDDATDQVAERDVLNRAFRRLSVEHRAAIVLRHYLALSVPDVADNLGIPLGTAKSRIHHAEQALRAALEADARAPRRSIETGR
jgi:RNA polymerase sigma-70 factor (ECF subfamily)